MLPLAKIPAVFFFLAFYQETYYNLICIRIYKNESLFIQIRVV